MSQRERKVRGKKREKAIYSLWFLVDFSLAALKFNVEANMINLMLQNFEPKHWNFCPTCTCINFKIIVIFRSSKKAYIISRSAHFQPVQDAIKKIIIILILTLSRSTPNIIIIIIIIILLLTTAWAVVFISSEVRTPSGDMGSSLAMEARLESMDFLKAFWGEESFSTWGLIRASFSRAVQVSSRFLITFASLRGGEEEECNKGGRGRKEEGG